MRLSFAFSLLLLISLASSFVYLASYCQGSDPIDVYDERYDSHAELPGAADWGTKTGKDDMVLAVVSRYNAKKISEWWLDSLITTGFNGRIVVLHDGSLSSSDADKLRAKGAEIATHTNDEYGNDLGEHCKTKLKSTSVRAFAVCRFWFPFAMFFGFLK